MKNKKMWAITRVVAILTLAVNNGVQAQAPAPEHLGGIISDYTPLNTAATPTGPYEMHGRWSLKVKGESGKADFSAFMTMELSDYWIWHSNSDASVATIRGAHTHHIIMTDAIVTYGASGCPADSPATTTRFMVSGTAKFITGNGNPGPFEVKGPTTLQVCVTGGSDVPYSNMTMAMTGPATGHFGAQPIHGVVRFTHKTEDRDDRDVCPTIENNSERR